jgi:hypothetical protein
MRVISYGGGVQSTALLVLACQGQLGTVDAALFANVGDDSEDPETLRYFETHAVPFAAAHQFPLVQLRKILRDGRVETLYERLMRPESRSLPIPVRMSDTGAPGTRSCTEDWKIKVVGRYLLQHGATPQHPADVLIGFSLDEAHRMGDGVERRKQPSRSILCQRREFPLIDLRLKREDCLNVIRRADLPIPPKSACYFCPYHKPSVWADLRRDRPVLFYKAADLERVLNERRVMLEKDAVYLTQFGRPLVAAIGEEMQTELDFGRGPGETCDEGYCWT